MNLPPILLPNPQQWVNPTFLLALHMEHSNGACWNYNGQPIGLANNETRRRNSRRLEHTL